MLDVKINKIYVVQTGGKSFIIPASAGLYRNIDVIFPAFLCNRIQEPGLHQRLASGKCNSASGMFEIKAVLINTPEQFIYRVILPKLLSSLGGTQLYTKSAGSTLCPVVLHHALFVHKDGAIGAFLQAETTSHTIDRIQSDFWLKRDAFRISTPETVKPASLKKNCGPHPAPIPVTTFLNIKNPACQLFHNLLSLARFLIINYHFVSLFCCSLFIPASKK